MVVLAAKRARQVLNGMPLLLEDEGHKPTVQALREMGEGLVSWETLAQVDEQMRQHQRAVEDGVA